MLGKNFRSQEYSQRLTQQFRQLREQILTQQKEQQQTQPTAKLIMLNFNEDYNLPGYHLRIKEFLEDDDSAKERRKKLQEFDDLENNCNNDYRLPDVFVERVQQELEWRATDKESQKIFWLQQAKLYDIDENDYDNVYRLIEDIYSQKEEVNSLDENPPEQQILAFDDEDKKLVQSVKNRKISTNQEEEGKEQGEGENKQAAMRKASSMSLRKESKQNQNDLDDSGYESEREELKRKLEQEQIEKEIALQDYLDDDQLEQLLDIDSDEDIIFNEKDQVYFFDKSKSPFDDLNKIYERRDSLHEQKIEFQKKFQKVIINAYKEKLKRKLYSKIKVEELDEEEDIENDDLYLFRRRESQRSQRSASAKENLEKLKNNKAIIDKLVPRGSFGTELKPPIDKTNASAVADKLRTSNRGDDLMKSKGNKPQGDGSNKNSEKDIADQLVGHPQMQQVQRQQSLASNKNMQQTFGVLEYNNKNPMVTTFGQNQVQQGQMKQQTQQSRVLLELLREELKNDEGQAIEDLLEGPSRDISPQKYAQQLQRSQMQQSNDRRKDSSSDNNLSPNTRYFYAKQQQEYKKEKKEKFVENLKDVLNPKAPKTDEDNYQDQDDESLISDKRRQAKEKRKAALVKSQKLQEERNKQIDIKSINEINQKLYGGEDRISLLGLKSTNLKSQKSQNSQDLQFGQTQIFSKSQLISHQGGGSISKQNQGQFNRNNSNSDGFSLGQSVNLGNKFSQGSPNRQGSNQTGFPINLQKVHSINNQQAYQQQQQLYSYLDRPQQQSDSNRQQYHNYQNQLQQQQQQLISPESSFIQNSFMQQLPAENINTARSNFSQFLYSARQDQGQQISGQESKQDFDTSENQQYERACMLLYTDLKKIIQIIIKDCQKKQDYSQVNNLNQQIQELEDIMSYRHNVSPNFLFMKLKIFRDEKKLKDHIEKMAFYNL